jgi:conjugal transfer mating pair stabilization protein TraG
MDVWEIYTYGGGEFLRLVFNGIATVFGDGDYMMALRIAALIGFFSVMIHIAMQKGQMDMKWIIGIIFVVSVMVVPKVRVAIQDEVVVSDSSIIDNIPLGLGVTASVFSVWGRWLTRSFETVFSLPSNVAYSKHGLLFASNLLEASSQFKINTPRVAQNFSEFWKSCVYYDLLLDLYSWDDLVTSDDLMGFLGSNSSKARHFLYQDSSNEKTFVICREAIAGSNSMVSDLKRDLQQEVEKAKSIYGVRLIPNAESQQAAVTEFASAMPSAFGYLTGISKNMTEIMNQNILANSLKRGFGSFANDVDATAAAQDFVMARAEQERRMTFATMGKLAKRMLPILQHLFEAFIYAIFPIVMLLAMLPVMGRVLMGYAKALFWINMWPPLYAILHFAMTFYGQKATQAAMIQSSSLDAGLSIMTHAGVGNVLSDYSMIAGYLSLSIPLIAWMMVSQSGAVMASLAGRMMQSYDAPVSKASEEITGGNAQLGQFRYDNSSSFQSNMAPSDMRGGFSYGDGQGNVSRMTDGGQGLMEIGSSKLPMSMEYGSSVVNSTQQSYQESVSNSQITAHNLAESNSAVVQDSTAAYDRAMQSENASDRISSSEQESIQEAQQTRSQLLNKYANEHGVSYQDTVSMSLGSKAIGAGADGKDIEKHGKVTESMASEEYTQAVSNEARLINESMKSSDSGQQYGNDESISASLSQQTQSSMAHSSAIETRQSALDSFNSASSVSAQMQAKGDDAFINYLGNEHNMSEGQVRGLISNANAGDPDSIAHRDQLANDYFKSELSNYVSNPIPDDMKKIVEDTGYQDIDSKDFNSDLKVTDQHNANLERTEAQSSKNADEFQRQKIMNVSSGPINNANASSSMGGVDGQDQFISNQENLKENVENQLDQGASGFGLLKSGFDRLFK